MELARDHRLAEARSLALHAEIAARLARDPAVVDRAKARVDEWLRTGSVSEPYARAWQALLAGPTSALLTALVDPSERMRALRQASPFAGVLSARDRWTIWRSVHATSNDP